jgi:DNA-binding NtrC family response regulator
MSATLGTSGTAAETLLSSERFLAIWDSATTARLAKSAVSEPLSPATPAASAPGWLEQTLVEVQSLSGAERLFFVDVKAMVSENETEARTGSGELASCLAAIDFDREPIPKPETKLPWELLRQALSSGRPLFLQDTVKAAEQPGFAGEALARARGLAAFPLVVNGHTRAVIYIDHRFQPLELRPEAGARLVALLESIGLRHALEKVTIENRSLWSDVLTLKARAQAAATGPLQRADKVRPLAQGRDALRRSFKGNYDSIIGNSAPMHEIFQLLDRIRNSSAPVLINGESGTGKELIANAIHLNSPRSSGAFVSENCGALTETLLESELFGYTRGAFTGATRDHKGLFELADGGTLFLDEVGDMSPAMQKKLLRALQESVIRPVGGKDYIRVDVRIISATNKDLLEEVRRGNFREDLYYRLNVINLKLPPLRDRSDDIPALVEHFLSQLSREAGVEKSIAAAASQLLAAYSWPGNIRELQNEVKRLFALSDSKVEVSHLSDAVRQGNTLDVLSANLEEELRSLPLKDALERVEKALIKRALISAHGNKSVVAKQLQIPKTSLYNKITKYQLDLEIRDLPLD